MNYKTLVVLLGNARGGEETWNTMYKYLIAPYNADLALLFGKTKNKTSSLYSNARFLWEINEYENWRTYYESTCKGNWFKVYERNKDYGLGGGIDGWPGSGAIIFAFRHYLKYNFKEQLKKYDRIILTRSDHYYIDNHPILPIDKFFVVDGEDCGGFSDRHHIFNKDMIDDALSIVDFLDNPEKTEDILKEGLNPEKALLLNFQDNGLIEKTLRCRRVQFTVATKDDSTRWMPGSIYMPGSTTLKLKYVTEYLLAIENLKKKNEKNNRVD